MGRSNSKNFAIFLTELAQGLLGFALALGGLKEHSNLNRVQVSPFGVLRETDAEAFFLRQLTFRIYPRFDLLFLQTLQSFVSSEPTEKLVRAVLPLDQNQGMN